jgi:hypothetical protein
MASVCQKMLDQAADIRRYRARKDNDDIFFSQHKLAERMKDHLLHQHRIKLSKEQNENMTELIADRVTGVTGEDDMNERMMGGVRRGGLALSESEADDLTRYFEKIIAQGVDVDYKA